MKYNVINSFVKTKQLSENYEKMPFIFRINGILAYKYLTFFI